MMVVLFATIVLAGIAAPHLLASDRAEPVVAIALWLSSLALRALTALFVAVWVIFFFPATDVFHALTHWCWHTVLPLIAAHLGFSGHVLGDAAAVAPSFVLAASAVSVGFGVVRAARSLRRLLTRTSIGPGPRDSVIVGGESVLLAAVGLRRPKVVVSAGALLLLDDDELEAGLEHERGHIRRGHRFILVFAEFCRSLGRFVPGTRRAMSDLCFHLERDADRWALAHRQDRYALASAVCKSALSARTTPAYSALGGGGGRVADRVRAIVDESDVRPQWRLVTRIVAVASVAVTLGFATAMPATVAAGEAQLRSAQPAHHCPH